MLQRASAARLLALWVILSLGGCASLPSLEGRTETAAIASVAGAPIPDALAAPLAAHPGPLRHLPAARRRGCVRGPHGDDRRHGAQPRHPVLHLARRPHRAADVRRAAPRRRSRRARAAAARRQQHRGARPDARRARRAPAGSRCGCSTRSCSARCGRSATSSTSRA